MSASATLVLRLGRCHRRQRAWTRSGDGHTDSSSRLFPQTLECIRDATSTLEHARTHRSGEHEPFSIVTDEALSDSQFGSGSGFSETGAGISPGRAASPGRTTVSAVRPGTPGLGGTSPGAGSFSGTRGRHASRYANRVVDVSSQVHRADPLPRHSGEPRPRPCRDCPPAGH